MKKTLFSNYELFPIITYCHNYGFITQNIAAKTTKLHRKRISNFFIKMVDQKFMTFKKIGRTNQYKLTSKGLVFAKLIDEHMRLIESISA